MRSKYENSFIKFRLYLSVVEIIVSADSTTIFFNLRSNELFK
ncbi:hypothetical protein H206_05197 [Candidatus Electrothrix aarhusensis]|uniref:Uncharacterized protein n=1 Tax=Candidatus Electrothrix aarhusensis TaxID=1859131 RepID=A0A3S3SR70_9BACT|nr:hypothetical protein H206_05197 [Candidatus Electrothrix aarhusensis]